MTALIIAEKASAAANMAKALGGKQGTYAGTPYKIINLVGHVMEFAQPQDQVPTNLSESYEKWVLANMPWNRSHMSWERIPSPGKADVLKNAVSAIRALTASDELVIGTDLDPSGEGDLLAWEVILEAGYTGYTTRMRFVDEGLPSLQKAFRERNEVTLETCGDYWKALARDKWDFLSMQLTRVATLVAQDKGYKCVVRQGRLKSVIVAEVGRQLAAFANYVKKPYYELRYKDEFGNVFKREDAEEAGLRYENEDDVPIKDAKTDMVTLDGVKKKTQAPPKLLDLAGLSAILAKEGIDPQTVLDTYQKMYEAQVVSYPRTEDKNVTPEQFKELLPLTDKIANLVGIDPNYLTHRSPRNTHVKPQGAHGANRPGLNVPNSLDDLAKYGKGAKEIYMLLAKSWLAMLAPDYEYDSYRAHLKNNPEYKAVSNVGTFLGFKAILGAEEDEEGETKQQPIADGSCADPFVYEGCNKRPQMPTMQWLKKRLEKFNVGTGATRTSTLADITDGSDKALLVNTRGKLTLTDIGAVSLFLLKDCMIADPAETERLFDDMAKVGKFELSEEELLSGFDRILEHDSAQMVENAKDLKSANQTIEVGKCPRCGESVIVRGKTYTCSSNKSKRLEDGSYEAISGCGFKILPISGKKLTDHQAAKLLSGKTIHVKGLVSNRTGNSYECDLALDPQSNNGIKPIFDKKPLPQKNKKKGK